MNDRFSLITGWDIGGAHLKAARLDSQGNLIDVLQVACPLWQGIDNLRQAIYSMQEKLGNHGDDIAAITMTGEMADIFNSRASGVCQILDCVSQCIPNSRIMVYAGESGWLSLEAAKRKWQSVASRNWQASASFIATKIDNALMIDIGSTTCDIIAIKRGKVMPTAYTDHQRQISRELLYTGVIRTPLIALASRAPFNGVDIGLAAEVFATTGDCWCLLDYLVPDKVQDTSADGRSWQYQHCIDRLARLLGTDASEVSRAKWQQLALWFAEQQIHLVLNAILHVLLLHTDMAEHAPIVGAGIGRFIAKDCSQRLHIPYQDISQLMPSSMHEAADHIPAAAVAWLAHRQLS